MASPAAYNPSFFLEPEVFTICGYVVTDGSGDVINSASYASTDQDQDGDPLTLPKGVSAIDHPATGVYVVTLSDTVGWFKLLDAQAEPHRPKAQATLVGTVDLTGLTLATLDGTTLILDADVGAASTTTFSTPTSVQDIADQLNAQAVTDSTSVEATILGGTYLKVVSTTYGDTSTLECDSSSTADGILGISNSATAGQDISTRMCVVDFNVRGRTVTTATADLSARTVTFVHHNDAGVPVDLLSSGFFFRLLLKNTSLR